MSAKKHIVVRPSTPRRKNRSFKREKQQTARGSGATMLKTSEGTIEKCHLKQKLIIIKREKSRPEGDSFCDQPGLWPRGKGGLKRETDTVQRENEAGSPQGLEGRISTCRKRCALVEQKKKEEGRNSPSKRGKYW